MFSFILHSGREETGQANLENYPYNGLPESELQLHACAATL